MSNFSPFLATPAFGPFVREAVAAERLAAVDPAGCVAGCWKAVEGAVRWMKGADEGLKDAWGESAAELLGSAEYRDLLESVVRRRVEYVRKTAAGAAGRRHKPGREEALLCLENVHVFLDFLAFCYAEEGARPGAEFDRAAALAAAGEPPEAADVASAEPSAGEPDAAARAVWTERRKSRRAGYVPKGVASEFATRKFYIDAMLEDAGWKEGVDWIDEYPVEGVETESGCGRADYALVGEDGRVLAIVEAKRTCRDVAAGRVQARLYAEAIGRRQGRMPVVFLSNGFETRIDDHRYPERRVAAVFPKRDLEKRRNLDGARRPLDGASADKGVAGRYYQEAAVRAVCDAFGKGNRRKALLVMATGSGKTRTVIALVKALLERGWVRDVLFLADRNALVRQAKRAFATLLPDLSATNLCEEKDNTGAHAVFSTYQTMMGCIDAVRDRRDGAPVFSCGHFDLVVCDEAHRSIYNRFRDIFAWFDAPLVGLTATPKDEIDRNTYETFELASGVPTYGYELGQAVKDGYLVDFTSVEVPLKFVREGIVYDELDEEEKAAYEETFRDGNGDVPPGMAPSALNEWIFNADTIRKALRFSVEHAIRTDYGQTIGKTIVFAQNHRHAEAILEVFGREFPELAGQAQVIDNVTDHAQEAIDAFSVADRMPRIAISVDMLDTGIDVPEVLNLVFFKKVMSKAKFWQMIGRGTRLCPGLLDGRDKEGFRIFDFCGNFEFFRMSKGKAGERTTSLQEALYGLKAQLVFKLQGAEDPELAAFRKGLVEELSGRARALDRGNFAVRQHLECVERFSEAAGWAGLSYADTLAIREELAPLVPPVPGDPKALRFDALLHGIELALLDGKTHARARKDLRRKAAALSELSDIPAVAAQSELLGRIAGTDWLDRAGLGDFERIRAALRDLVKFLPAERTVYETDFTDEILSEDWNDADLGDDGLENYRAKAEQYLKAHLDHPAVAKLKGNVPLSAADVEELERILWHDIGTRSEYEQACGKQPLGEFVRGIVGLDMNAAKEAFAEFLDASRLDGDQIHFVNLIVEYIVRYGTMTDLAVLQEPPFTDRGSVAEVFANAAVWARLRAAIARVNANAGVA